jgi:hypothetical protein
MTMHLVYFKSSGLLQILQVLTFHGGTFVQLAAVLEAGSQGQRAGPMASPI